jgi:hypothetical protein
MRPTTHDPTAGERARAIHDHRDDVPVTTDPTAGETARAYSEHREGRDEITDPTDPRYGLPRDAESGA